MKKNNKNLSSWKKPRKNPRLSEKNQEPKIGSKNLILGENPRSCNADCGRCCVWCTIDPVYKQRSL